MKTYRVRSAQKIKKHNTPTDEQVIICADNPATFCAEFTVVPVILKQLFSYGCNIQSVGLNDGDADAIELVEESVADGVAVAMVEVGIVILELVAMAEDNAVYTEEFSADVADAAVGKRELDIASDFAKAATKKNKEVRHQYLQARSFYSIVFSANRKSLTSIQYLLRKSIAMTAFVRPSSYGRSYHVIEL